VDSIKAYSNAYRSVKKVCTTSQETMTLSTPNGVIERYFGTLKCEHLYRGRIDDGDALAVEVNLFHRAYDTIRPTKLPPTRPHAMPSGRWQLSWP
jgi:hypothetical protein